jgi:hypothetical protein
MTQIEMPATRRAGMNDKITANATGPTSVADHRSTACQSKRAAPTRATQPGQDACHRTPNRSPPAVRPAIPRRRRQMALRLLTQPESGTISSRHLDPESVPDGANASRHGGPNETVLTTTGRSVVAAIRSATRTGLHVPSRRRCPESPAQAGAQARVVRPPPRQVLLWRCGPRSIRRSRDVTVGCQPGGASRRVRGRPRSPGSPARSGRRRRSWQPTAAPPRVRARRRA